jgi:hypothetical protein
MHAGDWLPFMALFPSCPTVDNWPGLQPHLLPYDGIANEILESLLSEHQCFSSAEAALEPGPFERPTLLPSLVALAWHRPPPQNFAVFNFSCCSCFLFFFEAFYTKTFQHFRDCRLYLGIMAATFGLPDDEIDRLLAEAEGRLAGAGSSDAVAVASVSTAPATVAAPVAANAGDQIAAPEKKSEKLSVRVPQLAQKQKVSVFSLPSLSAHVFHDEDLSQISMTLATSRHGYRAGTTMISYNHSYSDITHLPHACYLLSWSAQCTDLNQGPKDTLGSDWYNLPRTNLTPELKRDLQLLRMRDVVAMGKQFFKKETRKDFVPEYCQVGTIIAGATDGANGRLTRKERKRTIVEEVLSGENLAKFKGKYQDIQEKKKSGKKGHYKKVVAGWRKNG